MLSQQSWLYEDTANQLVNLARHQLLLAWWGCVCVCVCARACVSAFRSPSMPNFSLAPALDVLCSGSYPRLPSCIRDNIVPPSPLTGSDAESALDLLTVSVRRRLLSEELPQQMAVSSIGDSECVCVCVCVCRQYICLCIDRKGCGSVRSAK